jgi:uncharacterized membrane protein
MFAYGFATRSSFGVRRGESWVSWSERVIVDSRLPKLIFVLLILYAVVHFSYHYPQLPDVVASRFDGRGTPNGFQTKQAFFSVLVGVSVLIVVISFGIPAILTKIPVELINLPNKRYWLAPERAAETQNYFTAYFAWLGCALYLMILFAFDYALKSNLHPEAPPSFLGFWYVLAGFLAFTLVWMVRMIRHFARVPPDAVKL